MKTLKTLAAALLMTFSFSAFASQTTKNEKLEMSYALKTYVGAITQGQISALPGVLDKDVKFTTTRGEQIINHTRSEMLRILKANENVSQNCSTEYAVVESTPSLSVVKLVMNYGNFSKIEYLTLANTAEGWKITGVSTSFI